MILAQGDIRKIDDLVCGKKAILLILVKVYRKIYPGNRIQQIILLKIEKTSLVKIFFYFLNIKVTTIYAHFLVFKFLHYLKSYHFLY